MQTTKLADKNKKVQTGITLLSIARKEKNNQKWVESAQLAIKKGELILSKGIEAAKKELERVVKIRTELKKFQIEPKSDYKVLANMYETNLKLISLENLTLDYAREAEKRAEKFVDLNEQQKEIVAQFYDLKARKEFAVISQIKNFLEVVGAIKSEKKEAVKEAKKEAVKELA